MSGRQSQRIGEANERHCKAFLRQLGFAVYQTGAPGIPKGMRGHRGTMRTPGTPDFLVFSPTPGTTPSATVRGEPAVTFFFWEAKAGSATLNADQRWFRDLAQLAGVPFGSGDLEALKGFLQQLGLIRYDERTRVVRRVV